MTDDDVEDAVDPGGHGERHDIDVAYYTDVAGNLLTPGGAITTDETAAAVVGGGAIPSGTHGVLARNEQDFDTFLAGIIGFDQFTSREDATAVTGYLEGVCPATAGCNILPITFPVTTFDCNGTNKIVYDSPAAFWQNPSSVLVVPLCSNGPGNVGWIDWTPPAGGTSELRAAILTPSNPDSSGRTGTRSRRPAGPTASRTRCGTGMARWSRFRSSTRRATTPRPAPGVTDCPPGALGGNGPDQWTHIAAMTTFELCGPTIPECVSAGYDHGAYIQGSNGSVCATGNGATDCLVGRFVKTSYNGEVTAAPGPDPNNQTLGIQLIH